MGQAVVYSGRDLESMSFAVNYHKWILDEFRPFLGKDFVEVGAGTGSFSELLSRENPETLFLVEPSDMFDHLKSNVSQMTDSSRKYYYHSVFSEIAADIRRQQTPDSIIYVNVLEHIEDDAAELKVIYETLGEGGRCFIFVPALMSLYTNHDKKIGHFRRYAKTEIEDKCRAAGFKIEKSKYFDFAGILPWYVKFGLLKSEDVDAGSVALYDRWVVPLGKKMETFLNVPIGKNLLLIVRK